MAVDFELPPEIAELETTLRRFAEQELRPRMRAAESAGAWDARAIAFLDRFGIPALDVPTELGGTGAGSLAKVVALEALAWGDAGGLPDADIGPASAALLACPDPDVAREVFESCLAHEAAAHIALRTGDEAPGPLRIPWAAGSVPSRWVWLSRGHELLLYELGESPIADAGAAAFHASAAVALAQVEALPAERWQLEPEAARTLRGRTRLWPAAVSIGIADAALAHATAYARDRVVAGRPVAHHQGNAFLIAEAAAGLEGARLAVRAAAVALDAGDAWAGTWATLAYLEATETAPWICDLAVQLLGGHGYVEDHPVEKWFREAQMLTLLWGGRVYALAEAEEVVEAPDPLVEGPWS